MTIREIAEGAGLSHQAIYKRLKARGISLDSIKDSKTGELTADGERLLRELFPIKGEDAVEPPAAEDAAEEHEVEGPEDQVKELRNQVARLSAEVEKLRNKVAILEEREKSLTEERDFLRLSLERTQQIQMATITKIPNPPPALPVGDDQHGHGLRAWWRRITQGKREA